MRVDGGVYQGATVTVHYDPMVAKLVVWGADRMEAIDRLRRALAEFVVKGIKTSIPFHQKVVRHPVFIAGRYDTSFIETHMNGGKGGGPRGGRGGGRGAARGADARRDRRLPSREGAGHPGAGGDERSRRGRPLEAGRPARAAARGPAVNYEVAEKKGASVRVALRETGEGLYEITLDGKTVHVDAVRSGPNIYSIIEDGQQFEAMVDEKGAHGFDVLVGGRIFHLEVIDERSKLLAGSAAVVVSGPQTVTAEMPGKVVKAERRGRRRGARAPGHRDRRGHEDGERDPLPDRRHREGDRGRRGPDGRGRRDAVRGRAAARRDGPAPGSLRHRHRQRRRRRARARR